jgi:PAS domain S-box-containing protein
MDENRVNLLIVDDRKENLLAMTSLLDSPKYRIITATSGEEALRSILKEDFALILLDVQMPGMNGFETAKLIKSREKSKTIPIVFVTALSQATEHVLRGYEAGAIDFIFKPFHPAALCYKVEAFVSMYHYREHLKEQNVLIAKRSQELEEMNRKLTSVAAELYRAESLSRIIGETSTDTILTLNGRGEILAANPAAQTMFGYPPDLLISGDITKIVPGFELSHFCALPAEGSQHTPHSVEAIGGRKDGTSFPVEIIKGEAQVGDDRLYVYTIRDISVRKQLEAEREHQFTRLEQLVEERTEELKLSHDKLTDIMESITDSFLAVDQNWCIQYLNDYAEKQFRLSRQDTLGRVLWDVLEDMNPLSHRMLWKVYQERVPVRYELFSNVAGTWLEIRLFPSEFGISIYTSDVSERKQMEEDVRHTQDRFYKIFNASPSLISIHSISDGRYLDVNKSWLDHTGFEYEEVIHRAIDLKLSKDGVDEGEAWRLSPFSDVVRDMKISYETKSAEVRTGLLSTEIIEIQGESCVLSVITDITDRAMLERELARLDRLHLIGEMAAGIAHEIRNPMTTVRGFLQMAKSNAQNPSAQIIDIMVDELNRANSIITEFLTLAKNKATDRKRQPLNKLVESLFPLIQAEAMMSNKDVQLQLSDGPELYLDEKEIRQMLLNLALNGLEAMEAGGVLTVRTYTELPENRVVLEVQDEGCGMNKDVLEKLGTPFFTTKEQGTGLGLAVCYSIASRHNAKLDVRTNEQGTVFSVIFQIESAAVKKESSV